jgi:hypothetical protein
MKSLLKWLAIVAGFIFLWSAYEDYSWQIRVLPCAIGYLLFSIADLYKKLQAQEMEMQEIRGKLMEAENLAKLPPHIAFDDDLPTYEERK